MPNNIKSERNRANLTQKDLAEKLNTSEGTVRDWEKGRRTMPSNKLLEMSAIFGCTTDYILGRSSERTVLIQVTGI